MVQSGDAERSGAAEPGPGAAPPGRTTYTGWTARTYGDPEVMALEQLPVPTPGEGEVLVAVRAAAVDRGTLHVLTGLPLLARLAFGLRRPRHPSAVGRDLAGDVVATGEGVTRFAVGDAVMGSAPRGSFGEVSVAPEGRLVPKPAPWSYAEAAATTISGGTARQALDRGGVHAGQRVLVLGASGGVGSFAVLLAAGRGATVTAVCSRAKAEFVTGLGAVVVVDHQDPRMLAGDLAGALGRHDVIIDIGGNHSLRRLRKALAPRGTLVIVGGEEGGRVTGGLGRQGVAALVSPFVRQRLVSSLTSESHERTAELVAELAEHDVRAPVTRRYPLAEAPRALEDLAGGAVSGKVVLEVVPEVD